MTPRKRKTNYPFAGRPPIDPEKKVGTPVRALVTRNVAEAIRDASNGHGIPEPPHGIVSSDIVRLYLYYGLQKDGLLTPELEQDSSWTGLKEQGLL
jgi:hypothetical protein